MLMPDITLKGWLACASIITQVESHSMQQIFKAHYTHITEAVGLAATLTCVLATLVQRTPNAIWRGLWGGGSLSVMYNTQRCTMPTNLAQTTHNQSHWKQYNGISDLGLGLSSTVIMVGPWRNCPRWQINRSAFRGWVEPTYHLGSSGRATSLAMHPNATETCAALALLPGASVETLIVSQEFPCFQELEGCFFLSYHRPRVLFANVTVLSLSTWD